MARLVDLRLAYAYRTASSHLDEEVLGRLLDHSDLYRRAVAFFSSSVFGVAPEPFRAFFARGGRMKLVCSPWLSAPDAQALADSVYQRSKACAYYDSDEGPPLEEWSSPGPRPRLLTWLTATGRLLVKIAHLPNDNERDLYHEKIALFSDGDGHLVALTGSANESRAAYRRNFERLDAFATFGSDTDRQRARAVENEFRSLWENETPGVQVLPLYEALRLQVLRIRTDAGPSPFEDDAPSKVPPEVALRLPSQPEVLLPPAELSPRPHQREAIAAWARAGGRGVLEMATGSGKTLTALWVAQRLYDRLDAPFAVLMVAPFLHLVDQWRENARLFGLNPIRCAEGRKRWLDELGAGVSALNLGSRNLLSVVATSSTLASEPFQRLVRAIRRPFLIVGDECHNYGAERTSRALPRNAAYRLGLSATPERWRDEEGTRRVSDYFGPTVFSYSLEDALRDEVLTPYRYYPLLVPFDPEEAEEYLSLTKRIVRLLEGDERGPPNEAAKSLLLRRARLMASARGKLPALRRLLEPLRDQTHVLVYCGDGQVEGPDGASLVRQVEAVVRLLGRDLGMRCASYTASTPPDRRARLLKDFAAGDVQALVAIRCLDEGVDVPATRSAFLLASSTNPRQYVQRRGRVLRRFPGKKRAEIYDMFVTLPVESPQAQPELFRAARNLLRNQLRRASEFARLAQNEGIARHELLQIKRRLSLLDEG